MTNGRSFFRHDTKAKDILGIIDRIEVLQTFPDIPRYLGQDGIHREVLCYDYRQLTSGSGSWLWLWD